MKFYQEQMKPVSDSQLLSLKPYKKSVFPQCTTAFSHRLRLRNMEHKVAII